MGGSSVGEDEIGVGSGSFDRRKAYRSAGNCKDNFGCSYTGVFLS